MSRPLPPAGASRESGLQAPSVEACNRHDVELVGRRAAAAATLLVVLCHGEAATQTRRRNRRAAATRRAAASASPSPYAAIDAPVSVAGSRRRREPAETRLDSDQSLVGAQPGRRSSISRRTFGAAQPRWTVTAVDHRHRDIQELIVDVPSGPRCQCSCSCLRATPPTLSGP